MANTILNWISEWFNQIKQTCLKRFPLAIPVMVCFAITVGIAIGIENECKAVNILMLGFWALMLFLLEYYRAAENRTVTTTSQFAVRTVIVLWPLFMNLVITNQTAISIANAVYAVAIFMWVFLNPRGYNTRQAGNVTANIFSSVVISAIYLGIFLMLAGIVLAAIDFLLWNKCIDTLLRESVVAFWFPVLIIVFGIILLSLIPSNTEIAQTSFMNIGWIQKIVRFLLFPTTYVLYGILYIFLFQTIFQWELSEHSVGIFYIILSVLVILLFYIVNSYEPFSTQRFTRMVRILLFALWPLVILTTVGLVCRIQQYGLTISRVYLIIYLYTTARFSVIYAFRTPVKPFNGIMYVFMLCVLFSVTGLSTTITERSIAKHLTGSVPGQQYNERLRYLRSIHSTLAEPLSQQMENKSYNCTFKNIYSDAFKMGCMVNRSIVSGADAIADSIICAEFNSISPENDLKPEIVHPRPDVWNFAPADKYVEYGEKNGMFIIGHTLVWHNQTPSWFFVKDNGEKRSKADLQELMRSYIETVAGRYNGRINAWDVVNEIIDNDGSYRPTVWVKGFDGDGDALVRAAFRYAAQYAPNAELYYNDFNAWRPAKRDGIARMVRMLQANGIRIDGIGIQGHWGLNYPKNTYIEAAIDTFAALGVKVMITEQDIDVLPLTKDGQIIGQTMSDPQFQLEEFRQAWNPYTDGLSWDTEYLLRTRYAELFRIYWNKRDKIDRVTLWGLSDDMSWKNDYPIPNRTNYPLLWNRNRTPKTEIIDLLKSIPSM